MLFRSVHPALATVATLAWRSPVTGVIRVETRVKDRDVPAKDNPEAYRNDGIKYELRHGNRVLLQGARDGGDWETKTTDGLSVTKGDLLRLVILPGRSHWWDTTAIDLTITDSSGNRWNARDDLITKKMKLGNEMDATRDSVWWACAGDAPRFDPADLVVPAQPEYATSDGKVRFQGTAGAVQIRDGKASLSLGAPGRVRFGRHELAADGPEVKTFSQ